MGDKKKVTDVYVPKIKPPNPKTCDTATLKQDFGESLKDAWVRLREIHDNDLNPSSEAKLNTQFYFGLETWSKNALNFPAGGSFFLAPPGEADLIMKKIFCSNVVNKNTLEDMKLLLQSAKTRIENCAKRIPDKRNLDQLELLNQSVIPELEFSISTILNKVDSFRKELNKDEVQLDDAHKRTSMLSNVLKNAASFDSHHKPNLSDSLVNTTDETTKVEEYGFSLLIH